MRFEKLLGPKNNSDEVTMPKRVENKIAIVTGGSRGIGEGCARALAEEGARVVIADMRVEDGERTAQSIRQAGGDAVFEKTDVLEQKSIEACVAATLRRHKALDILVNNAGTHFPHTIDSLTPERWDFLIDLNLKSMYLFCKAALPEIRKRKGAIVNMSSLRGLIGQSDAAAYCASKAGIIGLTMALAKDEAKFGVRVNAVCPSNVLTPLMEEWIAKQNDPAGVRKLCENEQPLGRMASLLEIGRPTVFLASEDASFITGIALPVDGGANLG
jgi:NAD(P)-dependent dehydrogenase (short-subunit alcohol dehydrogenase family)